jgi:hypothetical protein
VADDTLAINEAVASPFGPGGSQAMDLSVVVKVPTQPAVDAIHRR